MKAHWKKTKVGNGGTLVNNTCTCSYEKKKIACIDGSGLTATNMEHALLKLYMYNIASVNLFTNVHVFFELRTNLKWSTMNNHL